MLCKPVVCWFKMNMVVCILATGTCLSCYLYYDGPTQLIDAGMRLVYVPSIVSIVISFVCILSLSSESRSTCVIIFCDIGLVVVFIASAYAHYSLQEVPLDLGEMTEYTQNYFKKTGKPPPFLDSIQQQMKCCGITGQKDYTQLMTFNNPSLQIPSSCCLPENCGQSSSEKPFQSLKKSPTPVRFIPREKEESNEAQSQFNSNPIKFLGRVKSREENLTKLNLENSTTDSIYYSNGCEKFFETIQSFLLSLPEKEKTRNLLTLPLELKDIYLRFITVFNLVLIFAFNYHLIRNRSRRRPTVILPRAPPPINHEDHTMDSRNFPFYQVPHYPPHPCQGVDGHHLSNIRQNRPRPEFGLHPFMLEAMMQPHQHLLSVNRNGPPPTAAISISLGHPDLLTSSVNYSNNDNLNFAPSAPPAYSPIAMH